MNADDKPAWYLVVMVFALAVALVAATFWTMAFTSADPTWLQGLTSTVVGALLGAMVLRRT